MANATAARLMTTEDLLALPDDGVERWLIDGELREGTMTVRNRFHSEVLFGVAFVLKEWLNRQPHPRGKVYGGEAGVRLSRDPDTTVGVDAAYVSADVAAGQAADTTLIDGVPTLVVEILSPSDTQQVIQEKIDKYVAAGVPLVWVIDPRRRTVTIYRPDAEPEFVNATQELSAEPHLPGFRVPALRLFE